MRTFVSYNLFGSESKLLKNFFVVSEGLLWIRCELFAQWGYYPVKRALVTTMSTRCTTGKKSRKNMFFKYRKDNRQHDQK